MPNEDLYKIYAIVIAGSLGSGKTTAAKFLSNKYDFQHLSFVEKIWKPILVERNQEFTRSNLQNLGIELMNTLGYEKIVNLLLSQATSQYIIIDDVRRGDVYKYIKDICLSTKLMYIDVDFEVRYPRLVKRDNVKNVEEQKKAEFVETEITIPELRKVADYIIYNLDNLELFYSTLDKVTSDIQKDFNSN